MPWTFEDAAPMIGTITEGNCWTGSHMLYSNVALNRIMRLDVKSGLVDVFAENTEGTNGLNYDADGNLYGCAGTGRRVVKFNDDGSFETVVRQHGRPQVSTALTTSRSIPLARSTSPTASAIQARMSG